MNIKRIYFDEWDLRDEDTEEFLCEVERTEFNECDFELDEDLVREAICDIENFCEEFSENIPNSYYFEFEDDEIVFDNFKLCNLTDDFNQIIKDYLIKGEYN